MRGPSLVALIVVVLTTPAAAESWYEGDAGRRRIAHLAVIGVGGALYISSETFLKDDLTADECRFCGPNSLDRRVRDALVWTGGDAAVRTSDVIGFAAAPTIALTLTAFASSGVEDRTARILDDTLPIVESAVLAGLVNQTFKFATGRRRPFVHFGDPTREPEIDDNNSFYSGHTTLAFALATSAGVVAHKRGYRLEPAIWACGGVLGVATGYLRIAADRHYFTDVLIGATTGIAVGITVPLVLHRNVQISPTTNGAVIAGTF